MSSNNNSIIIGYEYSTHNNYAYDVIVLYNNINKYTCTVYIFYIV